MRNLIDYLEAGELPRGIITSAERKPIEGFLQFFLQDSRFQSYLDELTMVTDNCFYPNDIKLVDSAVAVAPGVVNRILTDEEFRDYYYKMCGQILLMKRASVQSIMVAMIDTYFTIKASGYAVKLETLH